jgi:hypothetical protein
LKATRKYIVNQVDDVRHREIAELIDTFRHPNGRMMYTMMFSNREIRGYYFDELEPLIKLIQ